MRKKVMKFALLVAIGGLALSGCSSNDSATNTAGETTAAAEETTAAAEETTTDESVDCVPAHPGLVTVDPGFLTVATYEYPPFASIDGESLTGAEGEILNEIAALECLEVKVQPGSASAMIPAIETGRADTTVGSWYRTADRAKVVLLSDPVIIDQWVLVSIDGVGTIEGLVGKKVGSPLGYLWNEDMGAVLGDDLKLYETAQAMWVDFVNGRIDVVLDSIPASKLALSLTPVEGVQFIVPAPDDRVVATSKPGQTNFPVNLDNPDLLAAINADLATLRADGTLETIVVEWGFSPASVEETEPTLL